MGGQQDHSPRDASVDSFWINFVLFFCVITLFTTPVCYYTPRRMFGGPRQSGSLPILALPVELPESPGERV